MVRVNETWLGGRWEPDPLVLDDQAVVLSVRDKGLVVLTGCGHAGVVNIVRYAQRLTEAGMSVLSTKPENILDESRNRRHDFFVREIINLPKMLPIGRYLLKATIVGKGYCRSRRRSASRAEKSHELLVVEQGVLELGLEQRREADFAPQGDDRRVAASGRPARRPRRRAPSRGRSAPGGGRESGRGR